MIKPEEKQLLFRLRCRTTDVKMNMKRLYDTYECRACGLENESQNHVTNCKIILEMNEESKHEMNYEKIFSNNVSEQREICKQFQQNMKILEKIEK